MRRLTPLLAGAVVGALFFWLVLRERESKAADAPGADYKGAGATGTAGEGAPPEPASNLQVGIGPQAALPVAGSPSMGLVLESWSVGAPLAEPTAAQLEALREHRPGISEAFGAVGPGAGLA